MSSDNEMQPIIVQEIDSFLSMRLKQSQMMDSPMKNNMIESEYKRIQNSLHQLYNWESYKVISVVQFRH